MLHDTTLTRQVYGYDQDGDPITAHLVTDAEYGTVTLDADGTFTYTPNTHFVGSDSFTFRWSDGVSMSDVAGVQINVINNPPHFDPSEMQFEVFGDAQISVPGPGLLQGVSDPDGDQIVAVEVVQQPVYGSVQVSSDGSFTYTVPSWLPEYYPHDWFFSDTFGVRYRDSGNAASEIRQITIHFGVSMAMGSASDSSSDDTNNQAAQPANVANLIAQRVGGNVQNTHWVVVFAQEPAPGTGRSWIIVDNRISGGHAFIGVVSFANPQQSTSEIRGFYPAPGANPRRAAPGFVQDDSRRIGTVAAAGQINQQQYQAIVNQFQRDTNAPPNYHVFDYNCTNWAFDVLNGNTGIRWRPTQDPNLGALTPGRTGWELRNNPADNRLAQGTIILFPPGGN